MARSLLSRLVVAITVRPNAPAWHLILRYARCVKTRENDHGSTRRSLLYRRLRTLRIAAPLAAFVLVLGQQIVEHTALRSLDVFEHFMTQMLFYGVMGPVLAWGTLTWIAYRVRERDEAERQLVALYDVSREASSATEADSLIRLALRAARHVLGEVATSVVSRGHREGSWTLAGSLGFRPERLDELNAYLISAGGSLPCDGCSADRSNSVVGCELLAGAQSDIRTGKSAICFPLSTDDPPQAVLTIHEVDPTTVTIAEFRVLESMMAGLASGLDRARLRSQSLDALLQIDSGAGRTSGLKGAVGQILVDLAAAHQAEAGAVYLTPLGSEAFELVMVAEWPEATPDQNMLPAAQEAVASRNEVATVDTQNRHVVAIPLDVGELTLGALSLLRREPFTSLHMQFLHIAASVLATAVRNNQLNMQLEGQAVLAERSRIARELHDGLTQTLGFMNFKIQQIGRSLDRSQTDAAQMQLRELLVEVQQLYDDARLSVVDLRWNAEKRDLEESLRHAASVFESRSGLPATVSCKGVPKLPAREEAHLLAVVHEALSNVQKHANASQIWVRLRTLHSGFTIEVEDDGGGIGERSQPESGHFGMHIMRERAEDMGGTAEWLTSEHGGTLFRLSVPATAQAASRAES